MAVGPGVVEGRGDHAHYRYKRQRERDGNRRRRIFKPAKSHRPGAPGNPRAEMSCCDVASEQCRQYRGNSGR